MPPRIFYSTHAYGTKLASFGTLPLIDHDVKTLDNLTTEELNGRVLQEPRIKNHGTGDLGHLLHTIFKSFKTQVPRAEDLSILFSQIQHCDERINKQFCQKKPEDTVELWDKKEQKWNWALPNGPSNADSATTEHIFAAFLNALTAALSRTHNLERSNQLEANPIWSDANSTIPVKGEVISRKPDIIMSNEPHPRWANIKVVVELTSSDYATASRSSKTLDTKAYIIMKHQPWRRFILMLSFCNAYRELRVHIYDHTGSVVSPPFHIEDDKEVFLRIFSSIIFGNDECIGFDATIKIWNLKLEAPSPSRYSRPLPRRLHSAKRRERTSDRSGRDRPSSSRRHLETSTASQALLTPPPSDIFPDTKTAPPLPTSTLAELPLSATPASPAAFIGETSVPQMPPIGKIQVNEAWYEILEVLFSSHGLVGRGTVCYLVRKDKHEYIIKDHWVVGEADEVIMNEVKMLKKMKGTRGVPELVDYCQVKLSSGEVDCTNIYRYKKMPSFEGDLRTHVCLVMKPRGRPLHKFRTKLELVKAIRDIVISKCPY